MHYMIPSLYIHIPFCARRCIYCSFYSSIYNEEKARLFVDTIIAQLKTIDPHIYSVYIGGGTPSILDRKILERLLRALNSFSVASGEFTVEANPDSLDPDKLKLLLDLGVNRLSVGVQSLDERKLKALGRIHSAKRAGEALSLARKSGFKNISADLIFGVWNEDLNCWRAELNEAVKLPVEHISCYSLTYEKGTPLFDLVSKKSVAPLDDDVAADMYETAIDTLSLRGFKQYEVSNFAKEGYESAHNLNYWDNNPYIGLGPSAASYIDGVRTRNVSDVKEYIDRLNSGKPITEFSEKLSPIKSAKETAAFKIRVKNGIDFNWFKGKTGFDLQELEKKALPGLLEDGLIKYKRDGDSLTGIALKRKGFLFCDTVSSALL